MFVCFILFSLRRVVFFFFFCSLHDSGYYPAAHILGRRLLRVLRAAEVVVARSRGVQSPVSVMLGKNNTKTHTRTLRDYVWHVCITDERETESEKDMKKRE